jgi:cell wall-associated NlpC family hydrolase
MTTTRTSLSRRTSRTTRSALVAVMAGAGLMLSTVPATAAPVASAPLAAVAAPTSAAQIAVDTALAQVGKPYAWGGGGPSSFDCSGLVQYAYAAAGIDLPHSSRMQAGIGRSVSRSELQPGDLVAFYSPISHIGIYIGNGQMVHAPSSGDVVKVSSIDRMGGSPVAMTRIAG